MALLTDVLVASSSEAEAICRDLRHFENWPCWQINGFDNLVFSDLLRALGAEADAKALVGEDRLIYAETEGGPWVFDLPDVIPKTLSTLEDDEIPDLAERWLQRENRSEEHTSELQSPDHLVCRLLLEKKKKKQIKNLNAYRAE